MNKKDENKCQKILKKYHESEYSGALSILQDVQKVFGYIPEDVLFWFSKKTDIAASHFFSVATFYSLFRLKPPGKHVIKVCTGTACWANGADEILEAIKSKLGISLKEKSISDGMITLKKVPCIGVCGAKK